MTTSISMKKALLAFGAILLLYPEGAHAVDPMEGWDKAKVLLDIRYRNESVDQEGLANDAHASTVRARIGIRTGYYYYTRVLVEGEVIHKLGGSEYNDTINGRTTYPVVADPEGEEINQAYAEFIAIPDTVVKAGRVVQSLDNHRFIGTVGWRQNIQSFDGVFVKNLSLPDTEIFYGYIGKVQRIFGNDSAMGEWESNVQMVNVKNTSLPIGTVVGYAYLLDLFDAPTALSSQTYGGYLKGKRKLGGGVTLKWYFEYASQSDYGDNTNDYNAHYYHIAPAISWMGLTTTVGYEVLGSDNGAFAFTTPLATLHKFNGFADKFLATPATGLEDFYVDVTYKVKGLSGQMGMFNGLLMKAQYHKFESEFGNTDFGTEFDFYAKMPIRKGVYI